MSMNKDNFINKFREVWGNEYDYSKFDYRYSKEKGIIICKRHGEFLKEPNKHIRKGSPQGCTTCSNEKLSYTKSSRSDELLERFRAAHGERYGYSFISDRTRMKDKIEITCKEHGVFEQSVDAHMRGNNCPKCVGGVVKTNIDFMQDISEVMRSRYDYSLVGEFTGYTTVLDIICNSCNKVFKQSARYHVSGSGCPECNKTRGWRKSEWVKWCNTRGYDSVFVYLVKLKSDDEAFYKIGITNDMERRFNNKNRMPYNFEYVDYIEFKDFAKSYEYENELKECIRDFSYTPEKTFKGVTECLSEDGLFLVIQKFNNFKLQIKE